MVVIPVEISSFMMVRRLRGYHRILLLFRSVFPARNHPAWFGPEINPRLFLIIGVINEIDKWMIA